MVPGITARQAFPLLQYLRGDVDILPKLLERVAAQEEAVEKCRLVSRLGQARFCQWQR